MAGYRTRYVAGSRSALERGSLVRVEVVPSCPAAAAVQVRQPKHQVPPAVDVVMTLSRLVVSLPQNDLKPAFPTGAQKHRSGHGKSGIKARKVSRDDVATQKHKRKRSSLTFGSFGSSLKRSLFSQGKKDQHKQQNC